MSSIWEIDPTLGTPPHDPVDGRLNEPPGQGSGFGLGAIAQLAISVGRLCDRIDRQQKRWEQYERSVPADYQNAKALTYSTAAGTVNAMSLGRPELGQWWQVRRIIVGGSDITTAPAGTAWVFVQGSNPGASGANPNVAQAADVTTGTFPQRAFYGTHQLVVTQNEHLWIVITGGTNNTQYVASAKYEVFTYGASDRVADFAE